MLGYLSSAPFNLITGIVTIAFASFILWTTAPKEVPPTGQIRLGRILAVAIFLVGAIYLIVGVILLLAPLAE